MPYSRIYPLHEDGENSSGTCSKGKDMTIHRVLWDVPMYTTYFPQENSISLPDASHMICCLRASTCLIACVDILFCWSHHNLFLGGFAGFLGHSTFAILISGRRSERYRWCKYGHFFFKVLHPSLLNVAVSLICIPYLRAH